MSNPKAKERILETASSLFYRQGLHATGMEQIIRQADVARMTLYNHFPSKEALILAVLERHYENTRDLLEPIATDINRTPQQRLLDIFKFAEQCAAEPTFAGCPFINATAEHSDFNHPVHLVAIRYKRMFRGYIRDLTGSLQLASHDILADQLFILLEGIWVSSQVDRESAAGHAASTAAQILIEHYI